MCKCWKIFHVWILCDNNTLLHPTCIVVLLELSGLVYYVNILFTISYDYSFSLPDFVFTICSTIFTKPTVFVFVGSVAYLDDSCDDFPFLG